MERDTKQNRVAVSGLPARAKYWLVVVSRGQNRRIRRTFGGNAGALESDLAEGLNGERMRSICYVCVQIGDGVMKSEQTLLALGGSGQGCLDTSEADDFIASRLAESATGEVQNS